MTSPSGAPRYSSTRLLTYSIFPSGPALHTSAGIASTSKRSSCSLLVSASSGLLHSVDIDRSKADPQIQTFVVGDSELLGIANSPLSSYSLAPRDGRQPVGLVRSSGRQFRSGNSALRGCLLGQ